MSAETIVIKRYARSHLYAPTRSRYVIVDELKICSGVRLVVVDVETGDDVTRVLLA